MSFYDPKVIITKTEKVNFIVPERLREACVIRGMSYKEAAQACKINEVEFGLMANGHKEIPNEYLFNLMQGLGFPKGFFYILRWKRI